MLALDEPTFASAGEPAVLPIADAVNPHVKRAIDYWNSVRGERRFPARAELTLRGMAAILPFCVILSVVNAGADYEYRYVGEEQRQAFHIHFKGVRLSQIEAASAGLGRLLRGLYENVRLRGEPFVIRGRVVPDSHATNCLYHETVFLPLGRVVVDHLLIVGIQVPRPFWDIPPNTLKALAEKAHA